MAEFNLSKSDASGYAQQPPVPPVPPEVDRWNWGAFLLTWIWGVGNSTFVSLLVFVPFVGILIMPFVLGAKGSGWAWRNARWDSVEHFRRVQRKWAIWGVVLWGSAAILCACLIGSIFNALRSSDAYALGVARLQANPAVVSALGAPISAGFPSGSISVDGTTGHASLDFSASGSKANGHVVVEAEKHGGVWNLTRATIQIDGRDDTISLLNDTRAAIGGFSERRRAVTDVPVRLHQAIARGRPSNA